MNSIFILAFTSHFSLKGATQLAHWNVVGKDFYQLHQLFGKIYEIVSGHTDALAEQARGCGIEIPATVFNQVPEAEWSVGTDLVIWLKGLVVNYKTNLGLLRDQLEVEKNMGFVSIVDEYLSDANAILYLLESVLEY